MKPEIVLKPEFAEFIPDELKERTLYVAAKYRTVVHLCCCGCGRKVVTPLSPVSWKLTFDGVSITLYPSIGNWNLPCRSHYWIENNRVIWADQGTPDQIEDGRATEERGRPQFNQRPRPQIQSHSQTPVPAQRPTEKGPERRLGGLLGRLRRRLFR